MGSIRKRDDRGKPYLARYRAPDGRERTRAFTRKVDAQRWITERERDKYRGDWIDPALGRTTVSEWVERYHAGRLNLRASTTNRDESYFRSLILPTFGPLPIAALEPQPIREWVAKLDSDGYAPATTRKAYQLLAAALKLAVEDGLISRSPCRGVSLPKIEITEKRFLDHDEVDSLAAEIRPRFRVLVLCGAYTGLRPGELFALRLDRIDLLRRTLRVTETLTINRGSLGFGPPKSKAARRTVSFPAFLADEWAKHIRQYPGDDRLVFTAPEGGVVRPSQFRRRYWKPAVASSVEEPMTPHDLRHTHAALLIAEGEDPYVISKRLGHASIKTTYDHYGHLFEGRDEAAADALDEARRRSLADQARTKRGPEVVELRNE